jgi:hypothetical protein
MRKLGTGFSFCDREEEEVLGEGVEFVDAGGAGGS